MKKGSISVPMQANNRSPFIMQAFMTENKVNESMVTDKLEQTYVV